jgi:hypothetical protein
VLYLTATKLPAYYFTDAAVALRLHKGRNWLAAIAVRALAPIRREQFERAHLQCQRRMIRVFVEVRPQSMMRQKPQNNRQRAEARVASATFQRSASGRTTPLR